MRNAAPYSLNSLTKLLQTTQPTRRGVALWNTTAGLKNLRRFPSKRFARFLSTNCNDATLSLSWLLSDSASRSVTQANAREPYPPSWSLAAGLDTKTQVALADLAKKRLVQALADLNFLAIAATGLEKTIDIDIEQVLWSPEMWPPNEMPVHPPLSELILQGRKFPVASPLKHSFDALSLGYVDHNGNATEQAFAAGYEPVTPQIFATIKSDILRDWNLLAARKRLSLSETVLVWTRRIALMIFAESFHLSYRLTDYTLNDRVALFTCRPARPTVAQTPSAPTAGTDWYKHPKLTPTATAPQVEPLSPRVEVPCSNELMHVPNTHSLFYFDSGEVGSGSLRDWNPLVGFIGAAKLLRASEDVPSLGSDSSGSGLVGHSRRLVFRMTRGLLAAGCGHGSSSYLPPEIPGLLKPTSAAVEPEATQSLLSAYLAFPIAGCQLTAESVVALLRSAGLVASWFRAYGKTDPVSWTIRKAELTSLMDLPDANSVKPYVSLNVMTLNDVFDSSHKGIDVSTAELAVGHADYLTSAWALFVPPWTLWSSNKAERLRWLALYYVGVIRTAAASGGAPDEIDSAWRRLVRTLIACLNAAATYSESYAQLGEPEEAGVNAWATSLDRLGAMTPLVTKANSVGAPSDTFSAELQSLWLRFSDFVLRGVSQSREQLRSWFSSKLLLSSYYRDAVASALVLNPWLDVRRQPLGYPKPAAIVGARNTIRASLYAADWWFGDLGAERFAAVGILSDSQKRFMIWDQAKLIVPASGGQLGFVEVPIRPTDAVATHCKVPFSSADGVQALAAIGVEPDNDAVNYFTLASAILESAAIAYRSHMTSSSPNSFFGDTWVTGFPDTTYALLFRPVPVQSGAEVKSPNVPYGASAWESLALQNLSNMGTPLLDIKPSNPYLVAQLGEPPDNHRILYPNFAWVNDTIVPDIASQAGPKYPELLVSSGQRRVRTTAHSVVGLTAEIEMFVYALRALSLLINFESGSGDVPAGTNYQEGIGAVYAISKSPIPEVDQQGPNGPPWIPKLYSS